MEGRPISWPAGASFMCYTYGQKVWKFHGGRSGDKMPGEEQPLAPLPNEGSIGQKRSISHADDEADTRKLGRSCSTGSNYSSSESECSSQPSPLNEMTEDVTNEFLMPVSRYAVDDNVGSPPTPQGGAEGISEVGKIPCPPPSPVPPRSDVDLKALSNLITVLLRKHTMVQKGLEILKSQPALALRLQQRRTRKVLVDQGIIPPLKSPATYYGQAQKLERARKGDFLNKKMQDRPERDLLVQKHILEDTSAYDSIVAHQKELKKAKLVDNLNEKIYYRPGVFELVEKNILPADDNVAEALKGGHVQYKKTDDYEEDSSDGFSPGQPFSQDPSTSPLFGSPPPPTNFSSGGGPSTQTVLTRVSSSGSVMSPSTSWSEKTTIPSSILNKTDSSIHMVTSSAKMSRSSSSNHSSAGHHPYLFRQTSGTKNSKVTQSSMSQRNMRKKKEKPKFRKFKYHQYIPPDQQGKVIEASSTSMEMDTPYSRLLEQQQLYLRLQIMNQHYPPLLPNPKATGDKQMQDVNKNYHPAPPPAPPLKVGQKNEKTRKTFSVAQLEEMKVAELKEELKARGLKVTGTKEVLVERLKRFAIPSSKSISSSGNMSQPISPSITGLINATIQSTIRANTEQALAAHVNNNGPNSLLLRSRTMSPPIQKSQDGQQVLQSQISPPARFASKILGIQVVTSVAPTQTGTFKMQQSEQRQLSAVPMDTQSQEGQRNMDQSKPSTFHFTTTSNGVQIFSTAPALSSQTGTGQASKSNANLFFSNSVTSSSTPQVVTSSQAQQQVTMANNAVPGQRVIGTPSVQFKVEGAGGKPKYEAYKDQLLHKQQQEIEDLRRMVELHRTQLHQIQEKERKAKQDAASSNNNTSNNLSHDQQEQANQAIGNAERLMQRQHISQVLQKHLQNKISNKDQQQPVNINGLNAQMQLVKQELPSNQIRENLYNFPQNSMPPNVSLVPLKSPAGESTSNSAQHGQEPDAPVILSVKPPLERRLSENKDPPKYDQAIQMLNHEKRRHNPSFGSQENLVASPPGAMTNTDMDDLLELLTDKGEIPVTPEQSKVFPQQQQHPVNHRHQQATMHYQIYNPAEHQRERDPLLHRRNIEHLQRTISANELDNLQNHRRSLELPTVAHLPNMSHGGYQRKDPGLQRRHSGDLLSYTEPHTGLTPLFQDQTDFTSLLVSSAGDILMDSSRLPPSDIHGRLSYPNCISPESVSLHNQDGSVHNSVGHSTEDVSKSSSSTYLNMNDPYATQPFSPMDTSSCDGHRGGAMIEERVHDPHLSSSSIHDSQTSLDKCITHLPSSTGSYLRHYEQPLAGASPNRSHLSKSSSQEYLSAHSPGLDHSMQVDLNWLDLPLSSPFQAAPSPLHQRMSMHNSVGSILEHEDTGGTPSGLSNQEPQNSYHLGGDSMLPGSSDFTIDLIDSLDLNSIGSPTITDWEGL